MPSPTVPFSPDDRRAAARPNAGPPRRAVERAPGGAADALPRKQVVATLAGVLLSLLLAGLDQTIVSTAGPAIQRDLAMSPALYPWLTTAYLVASTVMVPIYGKLSDTYGRRPVLLAAIGIFLAGSVACGLSTTTPLLIAARALQGLGAAGLFTTAFAVIADIFPPNVRGKYTGLVGAVFGVASVVGPLAGGFLTDAFSWHWVFFVNVPVGALAVWFVAARMPNLGGRPGERPRLDLPGAFWLVVAVVPFLLALSVGHAEGASPGGRTAWLSPARLALFAVAIAGAAMFVRTERRAADPVVDLGLFRSRVVGLSIAATFVLGAGFLSAVVFLPLFMVNVVGVSATRAGLTMTPLTLGMMAGSILSGRVVTRLGRYRALLLGSLALLLAGFAMMALTISPASTQAELTVKMVLLGLGMGPTLPLYTLIVQNAAPPEDIGVITAASTFVRSLGQVVGVALVGSVFAATLGSAVARESAATLAALPPGARAAVERALAPAAGATAPAGEGGGGGFGFDAAQVRARLAAGPAPRAQDAPAAGGDVGAAAAGAPSPGAPAGAGAAASAAALTAADRDAALGAVGPLGEAFRRAFTDAVRRLYQTGMLFVVVGFGVSLFIPELPLRGRARGAVPAE